MSSPEQDGNSDPYGFHTKPDPYGAGENQQQPISPYPPPPPAIPYVHQPHPAYIQTVQVPMAPSSGYATAALICGILGFCLVVPSVFAIIFGHIAIKETKGGRMRGGGTAAAGLTLGYLIVGPLVAVGVWTLLFG